MKPGKFPVHGVPSFFLHFPKEQNLPSPHLGRNRQFRVQGGAGGLAVGWVDLDLECSTILLGHASNYRVTRQLESYILL